MKKYLILFSLLFPLVFVSCSKSTITSPDNGSKSMGKVAINIDKVNAPADVSVVIATMTKANTDTLTGFMNLVTDTTAGISFQNIEIGTWDLVVEAENASGTVLYRGESSVTVNEGSTTNVSLTLEQVQNGTGNVNITVTWAINQPYFVDYSSTPVYNGSDNTSGQNCITEAKILYDNGIYKMWYMCSYNASHGSIWYAESPDGISWSNKLSSPVLDVGPSGAWDALYVIPGAVIKDNGTYKMYYNGGNSPYGNHYIGLAISQDGVNWQRDTTPVLSYDNSQYFIAVESVIKVNGTYYMYYSASSINEYGHDCLYLAVSQDGRTWTKYQNNPILSPTLSWEGMGVSYGSVIYENNQFIMVYQVTAENAIGIAYSPDGVHWTKKYNRPVFSTSMTNLAFMEVCFPFLMKTNNQYRLYYMGDMTTSASGIMGIFMATASSIQ